MPQIEESAENWLLSKSAYFPSISAAMPRAEHKGTAPGEKRFQQGIIILEVVLEIGVLNQDVLPRSSHQTPPYGMSLPKRIILDNQFCTLMICVRDVKFTRPLRRVAFHTADPQFKIRD